MINRIARPWILESNASYRARIHLPAAARVSNAQKNYVWRPACRFFKKKEKSAQPRQTGFPGRFDHDTHFVPALHTRPALAMEASR
jgi:hypothetical protein